MLVQALASEGKKLAANSSSPLNSDQALSADDRKL